MRASKGLVLSLAVFLVFSLSLLGAFLGRDKKDGARNATLTLRYGRCDNALALCIPTDAFDATLGGGVCRVLSSASAPSKCCEIKNGVPLYYPSRLFSDLSFTVSVKVTERDGALYADGVFLSPGGRVLLSSAHFHGECEILSVKVG